MNSNNLDKELDRILYNIDLPATGKLINVQEWQKTQIKSTIREALLESMPNKRTRPILDMDNVLIDERSVPIAEGYNQAIDDCLEVLRRVLK